MRLAICFLMSAIATSLAFTALACSLASFCFSANAFFSAPSSFARVTLTFIVLLIMLYSLSLLLLLLVLLYLFHCMGLLDK